VVVQPPLTTVRQPVSGMASKIVATLLDQIEGCFPPAEVAHGSIAVQLIVRASTAAPRR
jgi:DNA-binding LacI/PurR family transcriptional regulator